MRCNHYRSQFTLRVDEELSAEELAQNEAHISSCDPCEQEWMNYLKATAALGQMGVQAVPDSHIESILSATVGTGFSTAVAKPEASRTFPLRRLASHAVAALAGAALLMLILRWMPPQPQGETLAVQTPLVIPEHPTEVSLAQQTPAEEIPSQVQVEYVERIVERVVERIQYVPLALPLGTRTVRVPVIEERNSPALQRSLARAGQALMFVGEALQANTEQQFALAQALQQPSLATQDTQLLDPQESGDFPLEGYAEQEQLPASQPTEEQEAALFVAMLEQDAPTLVIQRNGSQVSLQTNGTLHEIVPALIARLDDGDPRVNELVQGQLEEIWSHSTGLTFDTSPIAQPERREHAGVGWRRWLRKGTDPTPPEDLREQWDQWWTGEQVVVASADF